MIDLGCKVKGQIELWYFSITIVSLVYKYLASIISSTLAGMEQPTFKRNSFIINAFGIIFDLVIK